MGKSGPKRRRKAGGNEKPKAGGGEGQKPPVEIADKSASKTNEYKIHNKSRSDDYKKSSSSDYKKKSGQDDDTEFEDGRFPDVHKIRINLFGSCWSFILFIILLAVYYILDSMDINKAKGTTDQMHVNVRKTLAIFTENLDCSLVIKNVIFTGYFTRHAIQHGLVCLSLSELHSFSPISTFSGSLYYRQDDDRLQLDKLAFETNNKECSWLSLERCNLRDHAFLRAGIVKTNATLIKDSNLRRFFFYPGDPKNSSSNTNKQCFRDWIKSPGGSTLKNIRISSMMSRMAKQYNMFDKKENNTYERYVNNPWGVKLEDITTREGEMIVPDEGYAEYVYDSIFNSAPLPDKDVLDDSTQMVDLFDHKGRRSSFQSLIIPRDNSMSIVSSFIIRVVYLVMQNMPYKTEESFLRLFMIVNRIAYHNYEQSCEFIDKCNGTSLKKGLIDMSNDLIHKLKMQKDDYSMFINRTSARWDDAERVSSTLVWRADDYDFVSMFSFGNPHQLGPIRGIVVNGSESDIISAGAGVIAINVDTRYYFGKVDERETEHGKPFLAVTASGSIRTVEAVAITTLRYLIFGTPIDEAAQMPSAFYSLVDEKFYCEILDPKHETIASNLNNYMRMLDLECIPLRYNTTDKVVDENHFRLTDRTVMAVVKENTTLLTGFSTRMKNSFNYAAGY